MLFPGLAFVTGGVLGLVTAPVSRWSGVLAVRAGARPWGVALAVGIPTLVLPPLLWFPLSFAWTPSVDWVVCVAGGALLAGVAAAIYAGRKAALIAQADSRAWDRAYSGGDGTSTWG